MVLMVAAVVQNKPPRILGSLDAEINGWPKATGIAQLKTTTYIAFDANKLATAALQTAVTWTEPSAITTGQSS